MASHGPFINGSSSTQSLGLDAHRFFNEMTFGLVGIFILIIGAGVLLPKSVRLPDVEFLRISNKPGGKAGDADDIQAFLSDSLSAIMKGYNEYSKKGKHFLLRTPKQVYLIAATNFLDEIRKAPETHLSQPAAAEIIFQTRHTFHPTLVHDTYHFNVVKTKVTSALAYNIPDLVHESRYAFSVELGGKSHDWKALRMYPLATKIITRISNRMLVGPQLCRNDEFLHYSGDYTRTTFNTATVLRNYPEFVKSSLMYFMSDCNKQQQTARKFLVPMIKERLEIMAKSKNSKDTCEKPEDALQWLLDITPEEKRDPEILTQRMIQINVTAIHAPAVTLVECVFDLSRHPEIQEELRAEMAAVLGDKPVGTQVWKKASIDNLVKLDSFIRESARLTPMSAVKLERLAVKDYQLSDGTLIPRGTSVGVIAHGRHIDEDFLENATQFDAFRYARMRSSPETAMQYTFSQTSPDNLLFGFGRHACPGRHFASALIKICLVQILVQHDIRFVDGKPDPCGQWTQKFRNPDVEASVCFKLRETESRFRSMFD
ncbi:hypothetical protein PFICI_05091 [Pestalotiopsis fici W106-1]|uniref:Cytochrome P450 n=1 Tax=Pestalotiopsis fici (strain W106-1 / CGMCC3.15140) TaxID=1229662 RepID=W3XB00_PESFW|nr:uncharacterized protein PFICI_05091 [Pestalotiopsis fici W106-1]ETS83215.1 hypothetical protein PFICI_05091 [Pestalotiopsis fici W106-1]